MNGFGLFGSMFGETLVGGSCDDIEADPQADPFDKEVCRTFRQFERNVLFSELPVEHLDPNSHGEGHSKDSTDAKSLRDSILKRKSTREHNTSDPDVAPSPFHRSSRLDKDLDRDIERNPALLDQYLNRGDNGRSPSSYADDEPEGPPSAYRKGGGGGGGGGGSFSQSYSQVTVRLPDGSVEQRTTVVDSDGNEKTTVTYSDGGQDGTWKRSSSEREREGLGVFANKGPLDRLRDWLWK